MAEVYLNQVRKVFGKDVVAVSSTDLRIQDGELLVLVGPSGCGKSTTLRMIAGLEESTGGSIEIGGRVVNDVPPKDRDIAMVFQNYALYPHMNVYDNMAFGLKLRKLKRTEIERRVRRAADILGLGELLDRKPKALSGGQRQRVAMGRAIVREPAVFLFDEPLSNLDAKMRVEMRKEILNLHRRIGTTMVYVTHDQVEAMTIGDRICVMSNGLVEQTGEPTHVFDHPANLFVAGFIGTPPMNTFSGTLAREAGRLRFIGPSFEVDLPQRMHAALDKVIGKAVRLGLRPRSFWLPDETPASVRSTQITATVEVSEMLGEELLVHLRKGDHRFTVSVDHTSKRTSARNSPFAPTRSAHTFSRKRPEQT